MSRRVVMIAFIVSVAMVPAAFAQADTKVGVFDFEQLAQNTNEGQRLQKQLQEFQDQKQAELARKETNLKQLQDELIAQALALSPEKRSAMEKDIQKKQNGLAVSREGAQREWQIEFNEAQEIFLDKVRNVVNAIGREESFTLIFEQDQTVFRSDTVDITSNIIERLNNMTPPAADAGASSDSSSN